MEMGFLDLTTSKNEVRKMPKSVYYQVSWKIGREEK